jgi:mRNA-degrading endonuclease RelE of RelBE toxin-antitoxin system
MHSIVVSRQAIKDIASLPKEYACLVSQHIDRLATNPHPPDSKALRGIMDFSLRVGVYRILYSVNNDRQEITASSQTPS